MQSRAAYRPSVRTVILRNEDDDYRFRCPCKMNRHEVHSLGSPEHADSDASCRRAADAGPDHAALANAPGGPGRFPSNRDADAPSELGAAGAAAPEGQREGL